MGTVNEVAFDICLAQSKWNGFKKSSIVKVLQVVFLKFPEKDSLNYV